MAQTVFRLLLVEGPTPGQKIDLEKDEVIIGREETADIVIPSPAVSRKHIRLKIAGLTVGLEDLNSSNGTFLNGKQIKGTVEIKSGDQIGLGKSVLLTLEGPPPAQSNLATVLEGLKPPVSNGRSYAPPCRES